MATDQRKKTSRTKKKSETETLAWITDDEAEFWTSITPLKEELSPKSQLEASKPKKLASSASLPDGSFFKFDDQVDDEAQNRLNQKIIEHRNRQIAKESQENEDQSKQIYKNGEKNQLAKTFPQMNDHSEQTKRTDNGKQSSEILPGVNNQIKQTNEKDEKNVTSKIPQQNEEQTKKKFENSGNKESLPTGVNNQTNKNDKKSEASQAFPGTNDQLKQANKNDEQKETYQGIDDPLKQISENDKKRLSSEAFPGVNNQLNETNKNKNDEQKRTSDKFQGIDDQSKKTNENDEKKQTSDTLQLDENIDSKNKEISGASTSFINQLFRELKGSPLHKGDSSIKEEYSQNANNQIDTKKKDYGLSENDKNNLAKDGNGFDRFPSFIEQLQEETLVIRGALDEETFINRRSRQAKAARSSIDDNTKEITNNSD